MPCQSGPRAADCCGNRRAVRRRRAWVALRCSVARGSVAVQRQKGRSAMKEAELKAAIAEAVRLDREIAERGERLKVLKAGLVEEAARRKGEHVETGQGGRAWRCDGAGGCVCNVVFPAPLLRGSISGAAVETVRKLAGKAFPRLFVEVLSLKPVADFRAGARAELGKNAAKIIAACESEAAPRVSFETKRLAALPAAASMSGGD